MNVIMLAVINVLMITNVLASTKDTTSNTYLHNSSESFVENNNQGNKIKITNMTRSENKEEEQKKIKEPSFSKIEKGGKLLEEEKKKLVKEANLKNIEEELRNIEITWKTKGPNMKKNEFRNLKRKENRLKMIKKKLGNEINEINNNIEEVVKGIEEQKKIKQMKKFKEENKESLEKIKRILESHYLCEELKKSRENEVKKFSKENLNKDDDKIKGFKKLLEERIKFVEEQINFTDDRFKINEEVLKKWKNEKYELFYILEIINQFLGKNLHNEKQETILKEIFNDTVENKTKNRVENETSFDKNIYNSSIVDGTDSLYAPEPSTSRTFVYTSNDFINFHNIDNYSAKDFNKEKNVEIKENGNENNEISPSNSVVTNKISDNNINVSSSAGAIINTSSNGGDIVFEIKDQKEDLNNLTCNCNENFLDEFHNSSSTSETIITEPAPSETIVTTLDTSESIITELAPLETIVTTLDTSESIITEPAPLETIVTTLDTSESIITTLDISEFKTAKPAPLESIVTTLDTSETIITTLDTSETIVTTLDISESIITEPAPLESISSESKTTEPAPSETIVTTLNTSESKTNDPILFNEDPNYNLTDSNGIDIKNIFSDSKKELNNTNKKIDFLWGMLVGISLFGILVIILAKVLNKQFLI